MRAIGQTDRARMRTMEQTDRARMRAIEQNWDSRTPVHVSSDFYGVTGDWDPFSFFAPFEWEDLGQLRGREVIHLQCHLGTETIAFARNGAARTVGLDISGESVRQARRIAATSGDDVEYVHANVYDATRALPGQRFDLVYTGKGALCYLPDLEEWARTVAELLRPGGQLYVLEFHPLLHALGEVSGSGGENEELSLLHDYLGGRGPVEIDGTYTYTDGPPVRGAAHYEWRHGLGEVLSSLLGAGLRVTGTRESETLPWQNWKSMVRTPSGWWQLPPSAPRIPLLFAVSATKPA